MEEVTGVVEEVAGVVEEVAGGGRRWRSPELWRRWPEVEVAGVVEEVAGGGGGGEKMWRRGEEKRRTREEKGIEVERRRGEEKWRRGEVEGEVEERRRKERERRGCRRDSKFGIPPNNSVAHGLDMRHRIVFFLIFLILLENFFYWT